MKRPACIAIAGWKNSGKTSLVSALVTEITNRGWIVSTMKHAHHSFDLDTQGTDSHRHRTAGAREVVLVSQTRWAIQHELGDQPEPGFSQMLDRVSPCDLVIVEGYKYEDIPKIEIIGPELDGDRLWTKDTNVIAIACDTEIPDCPLPRFERGQSAKIADFIIEKTGLKA